MNKDKEKIIKFNNKNPYRVPTIKFADYFEGNGYLKITAINALSDRGYTVSTYGITEFQRDTGIPDNGVIDIVTFTFLINDYNIEIRNEILSKLDDWMYDKRYRINRRRFFYNLKISIISIMMIILSFIGAYHILWYIIFNLKGFRW